MEVAEDGRVATIKKAWLVLLVLLIAGLLAGCSSQPQKVISLQRTDPPAGGTDKTPVTVPLRVAVSSILSPKETLPVYQPVVKYLEERLGSPVVLLQRRTYKEVNDLLESGGADVAFVCSGGYAAGSQTFGMELLAVPVVKGERKYQSYIISRDKAPRSILDLRGRSFAFTDPMSYSGRIAPVYMLAARGEDAGKFFGRTFFTYSHDNAIQAVADGIVEAAAVDSMIFDQAAEKNPALARQVHIVDRSVLVGNPPVVVHPAVDPALKMKLRTLLLTLHETDTGRQALHALKYDRFSAPEDNDYVQLKDIWLGVRDKL